MYIGFSENPQNKISEYEIFVWNSASQDSTYQILVTNITLREFMA